MSIRLMIEIEGPLGPDDKDLLTGATMIMLALSQKLTGDDEAPATEATEPLPCADMEYVEADGGGLPLQATGRICVGEVGHKGRHKYRDLTPRIVTEGLN
jgi:hypothetical protein